MVRFGWSIKINWCDDIKFALKSWEKWEFSQWRLLLNRWQISRYKKLIKISKSKRGYFKWISALIRTG